MRLNLGCGSSKLTDYINIDMEGSCNPDLTIDFTVQKLPFPDNSQLEVVLFHTIEHIEKRKHRFIFEEIWRVLAPNCCLLLSYPEFTKCLNNYLTNFRGQKEFWEATIFGRQLYASDYHVCAIETSYLKETLERIGFVDFFDLEEQHEGWNTILCCSKGDKPLNYEKLLAEDFANIELKNLYL